MDKTSAWHCPAKFFVEKVQHMHVVRHFLNIFALALVFTLNACDQPSTPTAKLAQAPSLAAYHSADLLSTPMLKTNADPVRLLIPIIGINAPIEDVGVTPDNDLAVPARNPWVDVGWYGSGPRPGEQGSAVIDGHLDRPGGSPAVFWRLQDLHMGNEVMVIDASGKTLRFHVTGTAFYSPQEAPIQEIFGNETGAYLNLITCAGDWIPSQHQTSLRFVVYTKQIESK
jgi:sortase (surface protein transpeptidase)